MTEKLKNCPFCGGKAYVDRVTEDCPNAEITNGVSGILHSIDYKNKTATVEMDYEYLVEFAWDEVVICK